MRNELVHRLTHVGRRHPAESLPDRGRLGRVGALARPAMHATAVVAVLVAVTLALQLAAIAVGTGLGLQPLAMWAGVVAATAASPTLAGRLVAHVAHRA